MDIKIINDGYDSQVKNNHTNSKEELSIVRTLSVEEYLELKSKGL